MEFFYKGIDSTGKALKATIEASSLEEAKKKLKAQGILYSDLGTQETTFWGTVELFRHKKIPPMLLSTLSRDLAVYLEAGVPLSRALGLLRNQHRANPRMERFFETLISQIHEGKSFAQALEAQEHFVLPTYFTGTLKISEDRGILSEVLQELSVYLSLQEKIRKQLSQAMVYPSFIVAVSILMIAFMLSVVVPKITTIFESTGQALPPLTQLVIDAANFFGSYWLLMLLGISGAVAAFSFKMATSQPFKAAVHGWVLKVPVAGKMVETADLARFCTISSLLMRSGIPVINAIRLSCVTLSSEVIKSRFEEAAARVVEGSSLSKALGAGEGYRFDEAFVEAIAVGEETSEVSSMLHHLSGLYIETNKDKVAVFLSVLEPALMLFIGGVIGTMVTAMLLPIFSLNLG